MERSCRALMKLIWDGDAEKVGGKIDMKSVRDHRSDKVIPFAHKLFIDKEGGPLHGSERMNNSNGCKYRRLTYPSH